jgi:hypothetical protein
MVDGGEELGEAALVMHVHSGGAMRVSHFLSGLRSLGKKHKQNLDSPSPGGERQPPRRLAEASAK